jgi:DNA-binding NtrC family response regulator
MPLHLQTRLLRVLQEREITRLGATAPIPVDVRVIAATHQPLQQMIAERRFRQDLYYRINTLRLVLPPLRERREDVALLTDHFVARFARELNKPGVVLPADTRAALRAHRWPGNVRELQSVLKQALLRMSGNVLLPDFLPPAVTGKPRPTPIDPVDPAATAPRDPLDWDRFVGERFDAGSRDLYAECLSLMERQLFTRVLARTGGNQVKAAEALGITRGTLRTKLRALGLHVERTVSSDPEPVE